MPHVNARPPSLSRGKVAVLSRPSSGSIGPAGGRHSTWIPTISPVKLSWQHRKVFPGIPASWVGETSDSTRVHSGRWPQAATGGSGLPYQFLGFHAWHPTSHQYNSFTEIYDGTYKSPCFRDVVRISNSYRQKGPSYHIHINGSGVEIEQIGSQPQDPSTIFA